MNKILSWKINSGVYAYIYPVNNGKYISNRIPENSPIWEEVINEVSRWDKETYKNNFNLMNEEIKKKYSQEVAWDDNFFGFVDDNVVGSGGVNIVLLSGEGGCDGSGNGDGDISDGDGDIGSEVYDKFNEYIDQKLEEERSKIEAQNENVKQYIEDKVSETIGNARETIKKTKEELDSVRNDLESKLSSAEESLNRAAALFDLAEGGISPDDIKTCLSSVDEYGEWINTYSGDITTLKTDYDLAGEKLGSIGEAEDVVDGFFTRFATSLNVMDSTVGNVERWMVASAGTVGDMASWYNTNASSATEAFRMINASASQISDVINYVKGDEITVQMQNVMNAAKGEWLQEIKSETELGISNVERKMDAFSASIIDQITYLSPESALTSMGERMDAMDFEMEQWMTKTDSAMTTALDIRESWSAESGRLNTVASLVAETDSAGNILYYVSGTTNDNSKYEKVVAITDRFNDNGERIFVDEVGNEYFESHVYTHLSSELASYIQQTASGITLSAMGADGMTAAIKLAIENDKSIISLIASEVVIDANVIAKEIETKKATLGGIVMSNGLCYSLATNKSGEPLFKFDGTNGTIYANNAVISGTVYANKGEIGGIEINTSSLSATNFSVTSEGVVVANDIIINGGKLFGNNVEEDKLIFKDKDGNTVLYIGSVDKNEAGGKDPVMCGGFKDKKISAFKFSQTNNPSNLLYSTFIQPPALEDLLLGNIAINIPNHGMFYKGHGIILGPELMSTKLKYYDETNGYFIGILSSSTSSELCIIQEIMSSGWKDYKVFKQKEGDKTHEIKADDFASFKDAIDFADLLIYDDGSIESDYVTFNNGLFKGEIDSDGIFKGSLSGANGSINNVTIKNAVINKSLYVDEVLNVNGDYNNIFNTQYFSTEYSFYEQNKTKKSVTYSNSEEIVLFNKKNENGSDINVEIEEISGFIHRFIPYNRQASSASVIVTISGLNNIKYGNDNKTSIDGKFTYTQGELKSKGKHRNEFKTTKIKGTLPASGSLKITLSYKIPAANKYGASYGSAWVSVNKMRIFFDAKSKGLSINRNGLLYNSPNGKNGIEVTDDGIFFYLNNKKYSLNTSYLTLIGDK